jgi:hypothetical protein
LYSLSLVSLFHYRLELIPAEGLNAGLDVQLKDCRSEDFVPPPPPAYVAFSGTGSTLRGESSSNSPNSSSFIFTSSVLAEAVPLVLDETKPSTTLQVKTTQGKKIKIK